MLLLLCCCCCIPVAFFTSAFYRNLLESVFSVCLCIPVSHAPRLFCPAHLPAFCVAQTNTQQETESQTHLPLITSAETRRIVAMSHTPRNSILSSRSKFVQYVVTPEAERTMSIMEALKTRWACALPHIGIRRSRTPVRFIHETVDAESSLSFHHPC